MALAYGSGGGVSSKSWSFDAGHPGGVLQEIRCGDGKEEDEWHDQSQQLQEQQQANGPADAPRG